MLLDANEDKNPKRKIGFPYTLLHFAIRYSRLPICKIIVESLSKTHSKKELSTTLGDTLNEFRMIRKEISIEVIEWLNGVQFGLSL